MTSYIENLHSLPEHYFASLKGSDLQAFPSGRFSVPTWIFITVRVLPLVAGLVIGRSLPVQHRGVCLALHQKCFLSNPSQGRQVSLRVLVLCQESSLAQGFPKLWPELRENAEWGQMGCGGWGCEDAKHQDAGGRVSGSRGPPDRSILASSSSWRLSYGLRNGVRPMMTWRPVEAMASIGLYWPQLLPRPTLNPFKHHADFTPLLSWPGNSHRQSRKWWYHSGILTT